MKFYSEITKELYDSKDALVKAEAEAVKAKSARAEKAKEVTELLKKAKEANTAAYKALDEFCKEYGGFNTTIKSDGKNRNFEIKSDFWDIFDKFLF